MICWGGSGQKQYGLHKVCFWPYLTRHNVMLGVAWSIAFFMDFFSLNKIMFFLEIGCFEIFTKMKYFILVSKYFFRMFCGRTFRCWTFRCLTFNAPDLSSPDLSYPGPFVPGPIEAGPFGGFMKTELSCSATTSWTERVDLCPWLYPWQRRMNCILSYAHGQSLWLHPWQRWLLCIRYAPGRGGWPVSLALPLAEEADLYP